MTGDADGHLAAGDSAAPWAQPMGPFGTLSRLAVGLWLAGSVALGHLAGPFRPLPWLLGLIVFPAAAVGLHWLHVRHDAPRLDATGPVGHASQVILFLGMLAIPDHLPALWFMADAALLFYGGVMLLAAVLGQLGCEVLALSNRLLRRDDRVGCPIFAPFDYLDRRLIATIGRRRGSRRRGGLTHDRA